VNGGYELIECRGEGGTDDRADREPDLVTVDDVLVLVCVDTLDY